MIPAEVVGGFPLAAADLTSPVVDVMGGEEGGGPGAVVEEGAREVERGRGAFEFDLAATTAGVTTAGVMTGLGSSFFSSSYF